MRQSTPPTPGQKTKKPLHIPFAVGLLDEKGKDLIGTRDAFAQKVHEKFTFENIKSKPVLSLLRDFSAPVRMAYPQTDEELLFLLAHDSDPFNRWEAAQKLLPKYLLTQASGKKPVPADRDEKAHRGAWQCAARYEARCRDFKAMVFALPTESELGLAASAEGKLIDVDPLYASRRKMVLHDC